MHPTKNRKEKFRLFVAIFSPIFVTQVAMSLMGFFNASMSGNVASADLAGVAIGNSLWSPVYTGLSGILVAVTPTVSQLVGAGREREVPKTVQQGILAAFFISISLIAAGALSLEKILNLMDLEEEVKRTAHDYLVSLSFGIVPLLVYNVLRYFIDALGQTKTTMIITLLSVPLNVFFNYLFIFGKFGFPKLGGVGAGVASAITYWIICLIAILLITRIRPFSRYGIFRAFYGIHFPVLKELFRVGIPIGMAIFFETSIFAAITLLMSQYDTATVASYQAAANFTTILYMFPLSISMSLTILVAYEVGAGRLRDAGQYSRLGILTALILAFLNAVILYVFRYPIASLYTNEERVLEITARFLLFAIGFQFSDAIQASVQGALRGYKDVNASFITTFVAYWVIGLPAGYLLAGYGGMGPDGYWIGIISGLTAGAVGLSARLFYIQKIKYGGAFVKGERR
ncbi:MATE family efflux transporter [Caldibacillus debilis]|nr:MATE family efflux transporter [Caldibacillus debilis]